MMQLYSGTTCPFSHRCRFVLYVKGMDFQVIDVDLYNKPEDIAVMNPYNRLPVLIELAPVFTKTKHMLGDDFTMLDVAIAPLLWRLDHYGIKLGKTAAPLMKYAERLFSRPAFIDALTPSEKVTRK